MSFLPLWIKKFKIKEIDDETVGATAEDIIEATKDFILKKLSKRLKGHDHELFISDLLNAMGYRTTVSAQGGDSGIDITAYKDELPPRFQYHSKKNDTFQVRIKRLLLILNPAQNAAVCSIILLFYPKYNSLIFIGKSALCKQFT